jgi:hypothetical protein
MCLFPVVSLYRRTKQIEMARAKIHITHSAVLPFNVNGLSIKMYLSKPSCCH